MAADLRQAVSAATGLQSCFVDASQPVPATAAEAFVRCIPDQPDEPESVCQVVAGAALREQARQRIAGCFVREAHPNLVALLRQSRGDERDFFLFEHVEHCLAGLLRFNEHVLRAAGADLQLRFLFYQLLRAVEFLHERGVPHGRLHPSRVHLTPRLWLRLAAPTMAAAAAAALPREPAGCDSLTQRWAAGAVSNFDYLMALNAAAGRHMLDTATHPVLPWVTDFSEEGGGWRDLARSKFRLNKGDDQLDLAYHNSPVPHHVTESLSEITYFIYMARRTPLHVLRAVVRSNFQAREYPSSMARFFSWTPDDCIPEFYTDPSVFRSMHAELGDVELPAWCASPEAFVEYHRGMLESAHVSAHLHRWIDLTFGYALSGDAAVQAKNVPLPVVASNSTTRLRRTPGFVQLFHEPHPPRRVARAAPLPPAALRRTSRQLRRDSSESLAQALASMGRAHPPASFVPSRQAPASGVGPSAIADAVHAARADEAARDSTSSPPPFGETSSDEDELPLPGPPGPPGPPLGPGGDENNDVAVRSASPEPPTLEAEADAQHALLRNLPKIHLPSPAGGAPTDLTMALDDLERVSAFGAHVACMLEPVYAPLDAEPGTAAADCFALGCLLFEMYERIPLFVAQTRARYWAAEPADAPALELLPELDELPPAVRAAVGAMLDRDPARRPSAAAMLREPLPAPACARRPVPVATPPRALFPAYFGAAYAFLAALPDAPSVDAVRRVCRELCDTGFGLVLPVLVELMGSAPAMAAYFEPVARKIGPAKTQQLLVPKLGKLLDRLEDEDQLCALLGFSFCRDVSLLAGLPTLLQTLLPQLLDWGFVNCAGEALRTTVVATIVQLSQSDAAGPGVAARYFLPPLLARLTRPSGPPPDLKSLAQPSLLVQALVGVCEQVREGIIVERVLPRVFEVLPPLVAGGCPRRPADVAPLFEVLDLLHSLLPLLSAATVLDQYLLRETSCAPHHLLEVLTPVAGSDGTPLAGGHLHVKLARLITTMSHRLGSSDPSAVHDLVLPYVDKFFASFALAYPPSAGAEAAAPGVPIARELYAPLASLLGVDVMRERVPAAGRALVEQLLQGFGADTAAELDDAEARARAQAARRDRPSSIVRWLTKRRRQLTGRDRSDAGADSSSEILSFLSGPPGGGSREGSGVLGLGLGEDALEGLAEPPAAAAADDGLGVADDENATDDDDLGTDDDEPQPEPTMELRSLPDRRKSVVTAPRRPTWAPADADDASGTDSASDSENSPHHPKKNADKLSAAVRAAKVRNEEREAEQREQREQRDLETGVDPGVVWMLGGGDAAHPRPWQQVSSFWPLQMQVRHTFKAHSTAVKAMAAAPDESVVLTGSISGAVRAWRISEQPVVCQTAYGQHQRPVFAVRWLSPEVAVSCDRYVHVWDVNTGARLGVYANQAAPFVAVETLPLGTGVAMGLAAASGRNQIVAATASAVTCLDLRSGQLRLAADLAVAAQADFGAVRALAVPDSGRYVAVGSSTGHVSLLDHRSGRLLRHWVAHDAPIVRVFGCGARHIVTVAADRTAVAWTVGGDGEQPPARRTVVSGLPDSGPGVSAATCAMQRYDGMFYVFAASGHKLGAADIQNTPGPEVKASISPFYNASNVKIQKTKMCINALGVMPVHKLMLLGTDDGEIKAVV